MTRSTQRRFINRKALTAENIQKVLNLDQGNLPDKNLTAEMIFGSGNVQGDIIGEFVNGDGLPNVAPATRDIPSDFGQIDPPVPGDTPEEKLAEVIDGSYDVGD